MSRAEPLRKKGDFYEIKEGSFRVPTDANNPDAVRRDYHNPRTNQPGVAWELGFESISGLIEDIRFHENVLTDGTALRSLHIVFDEDSNNGRQKIVSVPVDGRYANNFLRKLPNIDFSKEVKLTPYDIQKNGPRNVGITVLQPDQTGVLVVKVRDFFEKMEEVDGKKIYTAMHGFPVADEEDRLDWPFYFKKVSKFLIRYTNENVLPKLKGIDRSIVPEVGAAVGDKDKVMDDVLDEVLGGADMRTTTAKVGANMPIDYPKEEINPDDIPF